MAYELQVTSEKIRGEKDGLRYFHGGGGNGSKDHAVGTYHHQSGKCLHPGFKAEHLLILNALQEESKPGENAVSLNSLVVDFARGISQRTDNPLDLYLQGDGFFVVQTKEGPAYTRKGDFTVNSLNQLVTQAGDPVVGEGGPITLQKR